MLYVRIVLQDILTRTRAKQPLNWLITLHEYYYRPERSNQSLLFFMNNTVSCTLGHSNTNEDWAAPELVDHSSWIQLQTRLVESMHVVLYE